MNKDQLLDLMHSESTASDADIELLTRKSADDAVYPITITLPEDEVSLLASVYSDVAPMMDTEYRIMARRTLYRVVASAQGKDVADATWRLAGGPGATPPDLIEPS